MKKAEESNQFAADSRVQIESLQRELNKISRKFESEQAKNH